GLDAGRAYAVLGALTGVGPILAPTLGAALLVITDWRGVFVALALAALPVFAAAVLWVPPMPAHHRRAGGTHETLSAFGTLLLVVVLAGAGLAAVLVCFLVAMAAIGLIMPNSTALALAGRGALTGAASALFGLFGFSFGAVAAPLVGVAGTSAVPLAIVMAVL